MKNLLLLSLSILALSACAKKGDRGFNGSDGKDGSSCSVAQASNGAVITCQDGTSTLILNGTNGADGQNAPPTAFTVTEILDPCGDAPGQFDEVLLRLANGQVIAHFASGNLQFLAVLSPGSYVTTDSQACHFTLNSDGTIN